MAKYAILNFEDKIDSTDRGAADSTVKALKYRYEVKRKPKGVQKLFVKGNAVNELRCVDQDGKFTRDATRLSAIRNACSTATKVYAVLHGDPRTPDTAYTNAQGGMGVAALCNARELAAFLVRVMPNSKNRTLALVMCYGARCRDYKSADVNHQSMMRLDDLKTSFAYRLVYYLKQMGSTPILTAVTGKIQHDHTSGQALIEREELIDVNMDLAETRRAFTNEAKLHGGGEAFKKTSAGQTQNARMQQLRADRAAIRSTLPAGDESNKYGKLVFRAKGNQLTIVNKYGGQGQDAVGPGTVIYKGALVGPG